MIHKLRLQNFRSYDDVTFDFGDTVNIVVGPNASGKTNLLEAILVVCRGGSYRAADRDLIKHGEEWARLDATIHDQDHIVKLQTQNAKLTKSYQLGANTYQRFTSSLSVPVVLFEPSHMQLLTDSPDLRRNFLDDIIEQIESGYHAMRHNYKRALAQRNSLLKQRFTPDQVFVWNVRLSELGGQLAASRQHFIDTHQDLLRDIYEQLADKPGAAANMTYETNLDTKAYASSMLKGLEARLQTDIERGYTTIGPHRDDLGLGLHKHVLSEVASRGETRTMLLALKLLEARAVEQARHTKPILLLDDVFSELDAKRRGALTTFIVDHQTVITTTDADTISKDFVKNVNTIKFG